MQKKTVANVDKPLNKEPQPEVKKREVPKFLQVQVEESKREEIKERFIEPQEIKFRDQSF